MADRYSKDKDYKVVTVIILTAQRGKEDRSYQLEASIGIYTDRIQSNSLDVFMKKADALMYQNKLQHKNRRKDEQVIKDYEKFCRIKTEIYRRPRVLQTISPSGSADDRTERDHESGQFLR